MRDQTASDAASSFEAGFLSDPHRRFNPLTGEWVLVSAGRTNRPWLGSRERTPTETRPRYDPTCYLCPGNGRAGGVTNPDYDGTFVFTNDFAAMRPDSATGRLEDGLLLAEGERGTCRVVCFSPRHDLTMSRMSPREVEAVIDVWAEQTTELGATWRWIQVFENRGEAMGASNPHPHGQIWAGEALPVQPSREDAAQRQHVALGGTTLLLDYVRQETGGPRVVVENDEWLIVVPFWAVWPFETLIVPKDPVHRLPDLGATQRASLAIGLIELLTRYDNLFDVPFPYSMGWHQAPFDDDRHDHWQLHAHVYPPLLRSATVRKFLVGYELLAESQRDITPEEAAERIREVSAEHEVPLGG
jgi:UDPglucose--hexose-1-phosphate uridylyltransferase